MGLEDETVRRYSRSESPQDGLRERKKIPLVEAGPGAAWRPDGQAVQAVRLPPGGALMYCVCISPIGDPGKPCALCGEVVPLIVQIEEETKICHWCGRRLSYQSMEFATDAKRCPECGKK